MSNETRRAVEGYFSAWTEKRLDDAFALLADDLEFSGPSAKYHSAAEFRPALNAFAALTRSARIDTVIVEGNRAAMIYDCQLPDPAGNVRIASFFVVENGKIRRYETLFDPTGFRQLTR